MGFVFLFFFLHFQKERRAAPTRSRQTGVLPAATQLPRGTSGAESLAGLKTCQDKGTRGSPAAPSAAGNHSSLCEALVYWVTSIRVAQLLDRVCGRFGLGQLSEDDGMSADVCQWGRGAVLQKD